MATLVQAVRLALHYGEEHLGVTDVFGEDVGPPLGGVFTATQGLQTAWNSPLDERGIIGTAMGIAYAGGRPVAEIQFCDYGFNTIDLLKVAGNQRWAGAGNYRHADGGDDAVRLRHPRQPVPLALVRELGQPRWPGWKIVMPSNALDAYGLMLSAIDDPNPVMVLLPKALLRVRGEQKHPRRAGRRGRAEGDDRRPGRRPQRAGSRAGRTCEEYFVRSARPAWSARATTPRWSATAGRCRCACRRPTSCERRRARRFDVIDLRSIFPYDWKAISAQRRRRRAGC